jgi:hypothetical protein
VKQVRSIAVVAAVGWDPAALRAEQLNDQDIGPILKALETRQRPEYKDITGCSCTYKSCWAQWKSLTLSNDIPERQWESTNRQSKIAQIFCGAEWTTCWSNYMVDHQDATWMSTEPWIRSSKGTTGYMQGKWCQQCATCAASCEPWTRNRGQMHH